VTRRRSDDVVLPELRARLDFAVDEAKSLLDRLRISRNHALAKNLPAAMDALGSARSEVASLRNVVLNALKSGGR